MRAMSIYLEYEDEGFTPPEGTEDLEALADALEPHGYAVRGLAHGYSIQAEEDHLEHLPGGVTDDALLKLGRVANRIDAAARRAGVQLPPLARVEVSPAAVGA